MLKLVPTIEFISMEADFFIYGHLCDATGVELNLFKENLKKHHLITDDLTRFNLVFESIWMAYKDTDWQILSDLFNELW